MLKPLVDKPMGPSKLGPYGGVSGIMKTGGLMVLFYARFAALNTQKTRAKDML